MTPVGKAQKQNGKRGRRPAEFDWSVGAVSRGVSATIGVKAVSLPVKAISCSIFVCLKRQKAHPSFPSRFFIGSMQFYLFD